MTIAMWPGLEVSRRPAENAAAPEAWRAGLISQSPLMETLFGQARRAAASDAAVCICGASGAGKELLARAIHRASRRAGAAFVTADCTANTENHQGLFQEAEGGTLYLDGVDNLAPDAQIRLLQALEQTVVRPFAASDPVAVKVRLISATGRRLDERVSEGVFRSDLYYRLNVVRLAVPPLSARREDIPLLVAHQLSRLAIDYRRPGLACSPGAMDLLVAASWPGNVRQLLNVIERVVALCSTDRVSEYMMRNALDADEREFTPLDQARRAFERDYLVRILKITGGNVTRAARLAGRNRTEFYRLLDRHQLAPAAFKTPLRS